VDGAVGEAPEQEGVDGAERELAALGRRPRARDVVEEPSDLGRGEIGIDDETGRRRHLRLQAFRLQGRARFRRAAILPDDRIGDRPAGRALPDQRRFALVDNPDRCEAACVACCAPKRLARRRERRSPQRFGVVLDPARTGIDLRKFGLRARDRRAVGAEHDRPGRGRP